MYLYIVRSEAETSGAQYIRWQKLNAEELYAELVATQPDRKITLERVDLESIILDVVEDIQNGHWEGVSFTTIETHDPGSLTFSEPVRSKREEDGADVLYLSAYVNGAATRFVIEPRNIRDSWKVTEHGNTVGRVYLESEGVPEFVAEPDALTEIGRSESLVGAAKILIENYLK